MNEEDLFKVECPRCQKDVRHFLITSLYECPVCKDFVTGNNTTSIKVYIRAIESVNKQLKESNKLLGLRLNRKQMVAQKISGTAVYKEPMYVEPRGDTFYVIRQHYPAKEGYSERDVEVAYLNRMVSGEVVMSLDDYGRCDVSELREIADIMDELNREGSYD